MTSSKCSDKWQLSAYERHRLPHKLVTDDTEVIVREERYVPDFTCPICFGVFRKAVATTGCLHRFCEECITTSLRKCNNECPTCRQLVSKQSLRRDYRMDAMIAALFPNHDEDGASPAERATASQGAQLRKGVKRSVPKQACEKSIVKDVRPKRCVKKARGEPISTAIGNDLAPTTANAGCVKVKANVPPVSAPTAQRRCLYVFPQPGQVGRISQAFAADADGVARKGSDYGLTARRAEGPQEPNAGARRVDAEVLGEGARPLPPPSVAFAGIARRSASNAVSAASPAQVDQDVTDTSEEASRTTSAQRSEPTQSKDFCADTGETSEDARGKSAADADAMPAAAAASDRESSSTAHAPRRIREYPITMTLKPHLDMFLANAESPTLRLSMTAHITIEGIAAYLRSRLFPDSVSRNDQRVPMSRIYAANEWGELVVLPATMTAEDAVKRIVKDGARLELYYALHKP